MVNIYTHNLYLQAAKALANLCICICTGLHEPSLLENMTSTKISCWLIILYDNIVYCIVYDMCKGNGEHLKLSISYSSPIFHDLIIRFLCQHRNPIISDIVLVNH